MKFRISQIVLTMVWSLLILFICHSTSFAKKKKFLNKSLGYIVIFSTTKDANIFIDDNFISTVPFEDPIELPSGTHTIKVTKRGYAEYSDQVTLKTGETREFEIDLIAFAGILKVSTNIPDAVIQLDNKILGNAPSEFEAPIGEHTILVRKDGYKESIKKIVVKAGQIYDVFFQLEPHEKSKILITVAEKPPFYKTWWFWTGTGVLVISGVVTAVVMAFSDHNAGLPTPDADVIALP